MKYEILHIWRLYYLKEYYEIINEVLNQDFSPEILIFFARNAFLIIKLSNLPSFRANQALIASQSTFEQNKLLHFLTFLLLFVSHFTQVWKCFDMWYFGNRFCYKCNIYSRQWSVPSVRMKLSHKIPINYAAQIKCIFPFFILLRWGLLCDVIDESELANIGF